MDVWTRLRAALDERSSQAPPPPAGGRVGAALALLSDPGGGDLEIVYTRRRDDLAHHPGQLSFPGGRVDPGETVEQAALREAGEECGLDPGSVSLLGALPAFYIPPSRFWLQVVVGRWQRPHRLVPAEAEVAEILTARLSQLRDERRWRVVRLSNRGESWAWELDGDHLLWGATAVVTAALLGLLDPTWNRGLEPGRLGPEFEVRPWARPEARAPRSGPARLAGVPEVVVDGLGAAGPLDPGRAAGDRSAAGHRGPVTAEAVRQAGCITADAVHRLLPAGARRRVVVLAGPGGTGATGAAAAAALLADGVDVRVVHPAGSCLHRHAEAAAGALGERLRAHDGRLPGADVAVDALVGRGLDGALRGRVLDVVDALREHTMPVLSVDLPSGVHPDDGLVGDTVAADVTIALGTPASGLFHAGLAPFVGDLYLAAGPGDHEPGEPLVRVVPGPAAGGWRE